MAIKDESAFEELQPYLKMTVAPNGVTVGDLNFVVAQTQWSTALIDPAVDNTIPADVSLDLFQSAIGDVGQNFTTGLTLGQTSWQDSQGRLPANQVFIATSCGFQLFIRDTASTTALANEFPIGQISAAASIARKLSWEVTIGDGITRNYGSLLDYAGYGGVYGVTNPVSVNASSGTTMIGNPDGKGRKLRIPLVFPPNISVRIKVRGGDAYTVDAEADTVAHNNQVFTASQFIAVKQYLHGYLCTMPVG